MAFLPLAMLFLSFEFLYIKGRLWGTILKSPVTVQWVLSTSYSVLLLGDIIRCAESADLKNGCSQSSLAMHELYFEIIMTILQSD